MKFYKSITFKLFVLLFLILTSFVSIVIYVQVYFIQRSYTIPDYTADKLRKIEPYVNMMAVKELGMSQDNYLSAMERFENNNSVNLVLLNQNLKKVWMTAETKTILDTYSIWYITDKINEFNYSMHHFPEPGNQQPIFHIFDRYNLPTKYIALITDCSKLCYSGNSSDSLGYIVTVVPAVFTSHSSGIVKGYTLYIFLFLMLVIFIVSALLAYFVTKPVMNINRTAADIANLDFSKKCEVRSDNEIGNLAKTINKMSNNLQNTLETLNTANNQLKNDLDLQKELDLMRRDFLAAVTHEFKTPITLIKGYTESIIDGVAQGEEKEAALSTIVNETEKMDRFVNDILELSKLESVGYKLNISEFYINGLISEINSGYRNIIKEKSIKIVDQYSNCNLLVLGDRFRIGQVITNFLNNAIDNTTSGKAITISVEANKDIAVMKVHNQGKGIEAKELDRIWEKFYRIEKSRNKKFGGAGLGLALSKSILNLHKSSFGVENTDDGVSFYFSLKLT